MILASLLKWVVHSSVEENFEGKKFQSKASQINFCFSTLTDLNKWPWKQVHYDPFNQDIISAHIKQKC